MPSVPVLLPLPSFLTSITLSILVCASNTFPPLASTALVFSPSSSLSFHPCRSIAIPRDIGCTLSPLFLNISTLLPLVISFLLSSFIPSFLSISLIPHSLLFFIPIISFFRIPFSSFFAFALIMDMFNTDSGFRPPPPLSFNAPVPGLFDKPTGYSDLFSSPSTVISPSTSVPAFPPTSVPQPDPSMMSLLLGSGGHQDGGLFNPSEQRYFSEFLDTLVVDQNFAFDPNMIPSLPSLPNLSLFSLPNHEQQQSLRSSTETPGYPPSLDYDQSPTSTTSSSNSGPLYDPGVVVPSQGERNGLYYYPSASLPTKRRMSLGTTTENDGSQDPVIVGSRIEAPLDPVSYQKETTHKMSKLTLGQQANSGSHHNRDDYSLSNPDQPRRDSPPLPLPTRYGTPRPMLASHRSISGTSLPRTRSHSQPQPRSSLPSQTVPPVPSMTHPYGSNDYSNNHSEYEYEYASDTPLHLRQHRPRRPPAQLNSDGKEDVDHSNSSNNSNSNANALTSNGTIKRKPFKELLTEEEKRANHIASEQKRRNTIRNGFRDMTEIIPDLKDLNSSKSTILFKAVDFIHTLEKRNRILKRRADKLESRLKIKQQHQQQLQERQQQQQQQQQRHHHHDPQQQQQHFQQTHSSSLRHQDLRSRSPSSSSQPISNGSPEQHSPPGTGSTQIYSQNYPVKQEPYSPYARSSAHQLQTSPHQNQRQLQPSYHPSDRLQDIPHLYPVR